MALCFVAQRERITHAGATQLVCSPAKGRLKRGWEIPGATILQQGRKPFNRSQQWNSVSLSTLVYQQPIQPFPVAHLRVLCLSYILVLRKMHVSLTDCMRLPRIEASPQRIFSAHSFVIRGKPWSDVLVYISCVWVHAGCRYLCADTALLSYRLLAFKNHQFSVLDRSLTRYGS